MLSYTPETINEVDRQCQPWPVHYIVLGPFGFRFYPTADADGTVIAWNISGSIDREPMTIWLPAAHKHAPSSQALNVPGGFTTGEWQGDTLVTTTTHIRMGPCTATACRTATRKFSRCISPGTEMMN